MGRKHASSSGGGVNLGLIVTPMLDMSFQLLAFFIMVYTPNTGEEFISGELARSKAENLAKDALGVKGALPDKKIKPLPGVDEKVPELEGAITVVLTTIHPESKGGAPPKLEEGKEGVTPRFIQLRTPANEIDKGAAKDRATLLDFAVIGEKDIFKTLEVLLQDFHKELTGKKAGAEEGKEDGKGAIKTKLKIEADRHIQFNYVVQVYAAAQRVGFDDITFTTPLE